MLLLDGRQCAVSLISKDASDSVGAERERELPRYTSVDAISDALHWFVLESRWQPTLWVTIATSIQPALSGSVTVEGDRAALLRIMQIVTSAVRVVIASPKATSA